MIYVFTYKNILQEYTAGAAEAAPKAHFWAAKQQCVDFRCFAPKAHFWAAKQQIFVVSAQKFFVFYFCQKKK